MSLNSIQYSLAACIRRVGDRRNLVILLSVEALVKLKDVIVILIHIIVSDSELRLRFDFKFLSLSWHKLSSYVKIVDEAEDGSLPRSVEELIGASVFNFAEHASALDLINAFPDCDCDGCPIVVHYVLVYDPKFLWDFLRPQAAIFLQYNTSASIGSPG